MFINLIVISDRKPDPSTWMSPTFSMFRPDHSGWDPLMVAANQGSVSFINPLTLRDDWHLNSPNNIIPKSHIKIMRNKKMTTSHISS